MSSQRPKHAPMTQFDVQDNCLQIGGMPITRLAQRVGSTPFYAYDRKKITERVALLRYHLPEAVQIHYAMKANPMPAVVQHLARLVDGIDVASAGELRIALDTPVNPASISFAGPGKRDAELSTAIAAGVMINIESRRELARIKAIAERNGYQARVAIRVNPDFALKQSGMRMGGGASQFGIDADQVPALCEDLSSPWLEFEGFHFYPGSQNRNAAAISEAHWKTIDLAVRLAKYTPQPPRMLNIGGGFGVPYFPGDEALDIAAIGSNLHSLMPLINERLPDVKVVIELGRYLVAEAGVYVCRVVDKKTSRDSVYLVTDGGMHHHLAASGNFGQIIRKNFPVVVANKVHATGSESEVATIVGPLCTPLDVLADRIELPSAEEGDLIAVLQSGAYGPTASPTAFLGHEMAKEVLV